MKERSEPLDDQILVMIPKKLKEDFQNKMREECKNASAVLRKLIEEQAYGPRKKRSN